MKKLAVIVAGLAIMSGMYVNHIATDVENKPVATVEAKAPAKEPAKPIKKLAPVSKDVPLSPELQRYIREESEKNGVPYVLTLAVIEQESRFDIAADGGDSFGLMQIHRIHGPKDIIMEPKENIRIGTWLLGYLWYRYHDWNQVLVAYNCGEHGAYEMYFRHGSISSPYSREVMLRSERFAALLGEPSVLRPKM